ncbi:MAG TPA: hypothetical protein VMV87_15930 [Burkholderiales bacterium]|nr:hypothetical protein [Burkholderiales bacterium]
MAPPNKPSRPISERLKRRTLYLPQQPPSDSTILESELADLLANNAVRQLCIYKSKIGYSLKVLPVWKDEFMTLIGTAIKEPRHYRSLDRLLVTITRHGPLPPTLLLDERL